VDPGKTWGVAMLDLEGRLVWASHGSGGSSEDMIGLINSVGRPIIIAGDRKQSSELVRKVNASFNSVLFEPKKDLSVDMKRSLAKDAKISNPHERDAYAAAAYAFKSYVAKFTHAEHLAKRRNADNIDEIKAKVVLKHSVDEAITGRKANRR
jgi:predicted RNase H-like nuclease (RuvC/YqgF family)